MGSLTHYHKESDDLRFHRYTEAWNARRGGEQVITGMVLGGWGHSTRNPNSDDLSITLSWPEGGGQDLAQWVTWADSTGLECRLFSFDPLPRKVTARLYRIDPGAFEITLHEAEEDTAGQLLWSRRQELQRYDTVTLEVPPGREVILGVAPGRSRPRRPPAAGPRRGRLRLRAQRLHPEGAGLQRRRESRHRRRGWWCGRWRVRNWGRRRCRRSRRPRTSWSAPRGWRWRGLPPSGGLVVTVDPGDAVRELYRGNNRAVVGGGG